MRRLLASSTTLWGIHPKRPRFCKLTPWSLYQSLPALFGLAWAFNSEGVGFQEMSPAPKYAGG